MGREEKTSSGGNNDNDTFVLLSKDIIFLDYQNVQILLTDARQGRDAIKKDGYRNRYNRRNSTVYC
jgi:hypothetical protein